MSWLILFNFIDICPIFFMIYFVYLVEFIVWHDWIHPETIKIFTIMIYFNSNYLIVSAEKKYFSIYLQTGVSKYENAMVAKT